MRRLLGATKVEMMTMDETLERLAKQTGTMSGTIEAARRRTRIVRSKQRAVEAPDADQAATLPDLGPDDPAPEEER